MFVKADILPVRYSLQTLDIHKSIGQVISPTDKSRNSCRSTFRVMFQIILHGQGICVSHILYFVHSLESSYAIILCCCCCCCVCVCVCVCVRARARFVLRYYAEVFRGRDFPTIAKHKHITYTDIPHSLSLHFLQKQKISIH